MVINTVLVSPILQKNLLRKIERYYKIFIFEKEVKRRILTLHYAETNWNHIYKVKFYERTARNYLS